MKQEIITIENLGSCLCTFYFNGKANIMIIDNVFVNENYRNKQIGTKLINKCIDLAKKEKVDSIELVVNSDNYIAKKLYEKLGLEKTNKEYYRLILNEWYNNNNDNI